MATIHFRKRVRSYSASPTDRTPNPTVSNEYIPDDLRNPDSHQRTFLLDAAQKYPEILEAIEIKVAPLTDAAVSKGLRLQDHATPVYHMLHYFGDDPKIPRKYEAEWSKFVIASI